MNLNLPNTFSFSLLSMSLLLTGCGGSDNNSTGTIKTSDGTQVEFLVNKTVPVSACADGGVSISTGIDTNKNGILDSTEVSNTQYVCNGATGATGANGVSGAAGSNGLNALVTMTTEPSGGNCATGGKKVSVGLDANKNAILDSTEVTSANYICNGTQGATGETGSTGASGTNGTNGSAGTNGTNGTNGLNTLVAIVSEPVGLNCTNGGMIVSYGLDLNTNNILDANEINTTAYVCNGVNGTNGMNGTTWRNNNGVPANNLGVDGDYYLNNLTGDIYVRSTGIYTIISNIKGATGATGPSGTQTLFGTNTNLGTTATQPPDCIIGQILLSAAPQYAYGVPANGQLLPISQNNALFSLMGTTYGGDGITTFALPDLRPVAPNGLTYSICTTGIFPSHP